MLRRPGVDVIRARASVASTYTKSVPLDDFLAKDERVSLLMEDPLHRAEIESAYSILKDVHPPVDLVAAKPDSPKRVECDRLLSEIFKEEKYFSLQQPLAGPEAVDPPIAGAPQWVEIVFFLRSGTVTEAALVAIRQVLNESFTDGLVRKVLAYPEWITPDVGGYRLVLEVDSKRAIHVREQYVD